MSPPVLQRLGAALRLLTTGAYGQAEAAALDVLQDRPDDPHAALLAGLAIAATGEAARAAPVLVAIAQAHPDAEHPCAEFAGFDPPFPRRLVGRQFESCLRLAPDDTRLRLAFAAFLIDNDRAAEAQALLAEAPDTAAAQHLKGLALAETGAFSAALEAFRRTTVLAPNAAPAWSNLGMMLKTENRFEAARAAYDRAVALAPDNPRFRVNRAVAHLRSGAWHLAWPDYEARLDLPGVPPFDKQRLLPPLRPGERLDGVTVLALHEDGFGDTLHFCRYLPLLADRGARVAACVPPELETVLRGVPGVAEVITDIRHARPGGADHAPSHDAHHAAPHDLRPVPAQSTHRPLIYDAICPMFSLPGVFRTGLDTIPPPPRLSIDPALRQRWAWRLPAGRALKAGLVWAGQARPSAPGFGALDRRRSAGLQAFEPLFDVPDVSFVSLQMGLAAGQTRPMNLTLFDPMPMVRSFADTAAIIANLDLVISVDTSVVHLAGLLDKPVFMLDRYDNCWRWLSGRGDSPWYPRLRIFRQHRPNDWTVAVTQAAAALHDAAACHHAHADKPQAIA